MVEPCMTAFGGTHQRVPRQANRPFLRERGGAGRLPDDHRRLRLLQDERPFPDPAGDPATRTKSVFIQEARGFGVCKAADPA